MKNKLLMVGLITLAVTVISCKKYSAGCMDSTAENYSTYAKVDDGSCIYHASSDVTISNWAYNDPIYSAIITWDAITQDVIDRGSFSIFQIVNTSELVELPYTISISSSYSSHWFYEVGVGQVEVFRWDSDLIDPGNPGAQSFKVVANW